MPADRIAHGEIKVTLNDHEALDGMARIDREFHRTMRDIERETAQAKIDADLRPLERKLKQARREVRRLEGRAIELEIDADDEEFHAQLAAARKEVKRLDGQKARVEIEVEGEQAALDAQKRIAAVQEKVRRANEKAQRDRIRELQRESRVSAALNRQRERELATDHTAALRMNAQLERAADIERRRPLEVAKARQQYAALQQQVAKIEQEQRRPRAIFAPSGVRQRFDIDKQRALEQMAELRVQLEAMGADPIEIDVDVDRSTTALSRWLRTLSEVTVRVGPFTTSIRTLSVALVTLGPILTGLVGATLALIAPLGAGLVGAAGAATAGLLGFGLAAGGIFAIVKPLAGELANVTKASKAYDKAVREHGEGSDQAAKKLKVLHSVMGHVDDRTVEQFKLLGRLSDRWKDLTSDARPIFFETMGEGIETVNALMPRFASRSVQAFRAVSTGAREWMRGLRGREGQSVIDTIFGNFNRAIPSFMRGLGSLGAALGRVAASFSRHLMPLGQGFEGWARRLSDATKNTARLDSGVSKLVNSMRQVGSFIAAAGRVLIQFFRAGLGPGGGFLQRLTDGMNGLARSMASVKGQQGLTDFFQQAIGTTVRLWNVLQPLLALFIEMVTIMRPFTNILLDVAGAFSRVIAAVADLGPVRALLQAAFAIFLTRSLVGGIRSVVGAVQALVGALKVLTGMQIGSALLSVLGLPTGRRGRNVAPLAGRIPGVPATLAAGAAGGAAPAAARQAAASGGSFANAVRSGAQLAKAAKSATLVGAALTAAEIAANKLNISFSHNRQATNLAGQSWDDISRSLTWAGEQLGIVDTRQEQVNQRLREGANVLRLSRGAIQSSTLAAADAGLQYQQAILAERDAQRQLNELRRSGTATADQLRQAELNVALATRERQRANGYLVVAQRQVRDSTNIQINQMRAQRSETERGSEAWNRWTRGIERAHARGRTATVNLERTSRGLRPIMEENELAVGRFARRFQDIPAARKLLFTLDDTQALTKIATLSNRIETLAGGKGRAAVIDIIADPNATTEQKLNRLRRLLRDLDTTKANPRVDADTDNADRRINGTRAGVAGLDRARARPRVEADTDEANRRINGTRAGVAGLNRMTARPQVTVDVKFNIEGGIGGVPEGGPSGGPQGAIVRGATARAREWGRDFARRNPEQVLLGAGLGGGRVAAVDAFTPIAARYGLQMTSGFRRGDKGFHGLNRARDYSNSSGPTSQMAAFARFMAASFGRRLKELIYSPLGWGIKNGQRVPNSFWGGDVVRDHYDHVHVAYRRGGTFGGPSLLKRPVVSAAEEAPRHPEFFIPTNPAYRGRAQELVVQAAQHVGFASGGIHAVAAAARKAGFKSTALKIAIAVAMAESSGNPGAVGDGGASHGLWQIHRPSHPRWARQNLLNPNVNARAAYDISGGGRNWRPWTMFRNGGFRRYLDAARAAAMASAGPEAARGGGRSSAGGSDFDPVAALEQRIAEARGAGRFSTPMIPIPAEADPVGVPGGMMRPGATSQQRYRAGAPGALALERELHGVREERRLRLQERLASTTRDLRRERDPRRRGRLRNRRDELLGQLAELVQAIREGNQRRLEITKDMPLANQAALAELTPTLTDNVQATQRLADLWRDRLRNAQRRGDLPKIAEAAANLKQYQDQLVQLQEQERLQGPQQAMAQAELTGTLTDDVSALNQFIGALEKNYADALASRDPARIAAAASALASARTQLTQMQDRVRLQGPQQAVAQAELTTTLTDDVDALSQLVNALTHNYNVALQSGDPERIAAAASALAQARNNMRQLQDRAALLPIQAAQAIAQLTPQMDDDMASLRQLEGHYSDALARAQREGDYESIIENANALHQVREQLGQQAERVAMDQRSLGEARADMFRSFGSNVRGLLQTIPHERLVGAYGPNEGGGITIIHNNSFPTPPPDPHTWSRGVAFELQAAV